MTDPAPTLQCDDCGALVEHLRRDGAVVLVCDCPREREVVTTERLPGAWR